MAITIDGALQDLGGDAILADLEGQTLNLYGGTPPADAKATQTNGVIATGSAPNFDAHSGDAGADMSSTAALTGTAGASTGTNATHFRFLGATGVVQGDVGATSSGEDIEVDNVNIAEGQEVNVTAFNFTMPDGT